MESKWGQREGLGRILECFNLSLLDRTQMYDIAANEINKVFTIDIN
jgi:hypothetical protein